MTIGQWLTTDWRNSMFPFCGTPIPSSCGVNTGIINQNNDIYYLCTVR